jgi:phenylacetate-CoA ligase
MAGMTIDLSRLPLKAAAFSSRPMTLCDPAFVNALAPSIDVVALETAPRVLREQWQARQLANLLGHAAARSAFWRKRIGGRSPAAIKLATLPILSRAELKGQVESEGSLLGPADKLRIQRHSTSGSSGTPVSFFITEATARYNELRSFAQYLLEGRDLTLNKTHLRTAASAGPGGFDTTREASWLGSLSPYLKGGSLRKITYVLPDVERLCKVLEREPLGHLVAGPKAMEMLLQARTPADLKRAGLAMFIPIGEATTPEMRQAFREQDVPVRAYYSTEEVGTIGVECTQVPDAYHVCESGLIVEVSEADAVMVDGQRLGHVLITALHSYATVFIRYDVGDLASLAPRCACGHDGPTLSNVRGRSKAYITHANGAVSPFHLQAAVLRAVCAFDEFRIRQTAQEHIVAEIGRNQPLSEAEIQGFRNVIAVQTGPKFNIEVRWMNQIDWGGAVKRSGFRNELV